MRGSEAGHGPRAALATRRAWPRPRVPATRRCLRPSAEADIRLDLKKSHVLEELAISAAVSWPVGTLNL